MRFFALHIYPNQRQHGSRFKWITRSASCTWWVRLVSWATLEPSLHFPGHIRKQIVLVHADCKNDYAANNLTICLAGNLALQLRIMNYIYGLFRTNVSTVVSHFGTLSLFFFPRTSYRARSHKGRISAYVFQHRKRTTNKRYAFGRPLHRACPHKRCFDAACALRHIAHWCIVKPACLQRPVLIDADISGTA